MTNSDESSVVQIANSKNGRKRLVEYVEGLCAMDKALVLHGLWSGFRDYTDEIVESHSEVSPVIDTLTEDFGSSDMMINNLIVDTVKVILNAAKEMQDVYRANLDAALTKAMMGLEIPLRNVGSLEELQRKVEARLRERARDSGREDRLVKELRMLEAIIEEDDLMDDLEDECGRAETDFEWGEMNAEWEEWLRRRGDED